MAKIMQLLGDNFFTLGHELTKGSGMQAGSRAKERKEREPEQWKEREKYQWKETTSV